MSMVGQQLREAREAQNLTVHQVAEITKIRTDHLRALEEGNFDVFPAPVYIRGSIRSYAGLLGLNVPQLMTALQRELNDSGKHPEPLDRAKRKRGVLDIAMFQLSRLNWRVTLPIAAAILVLGGGWWAYRLISEHNAKDPLANLGAGVYQPPKSNSGETLPLPTPTQPRR